MVHLSVHRFWTGGAWIMYFADAPTLTRDFWTGNAAASPIPPSAC
jgi:hypothetical protein